MGKSRTTIELETFRKHAQAMSVKTTESPEDRAQWRKLASEAEEHLTREAIEEGLFVIPEQPGEPTLF